MTDSKKEELLKACDRLQNEARIHRNLATNHDSDSVNKLVQDIELVATALKPFLTEREGMVLIPKEPTEEMIDAPRQIILYATADPSRTLEGLREHLTHCGLDYYLSWFPVWATQETGHLTKGSIAILIYKTMIAAAPKQEKSE